MTQPRLKGIKRIAFLPCGNCGMLVHPDDLRRMEALDCDACVPCREMSRMLVLSTRQTVSSLCEFAQNVLRHRGRKAYQTSMAQVQFRKGGS